jgi:hypothetical protein
MGLARPLSYQIAGTLLRVTQASASSARSYAHLGLQRQELAEASHYDSLPDIPSQEQR